MAVMTERTKLVAVRHPINVGRPGGKAKYKMIPYGVGSASSVKHGCVVDGMLMMEVPIQRDAEGRQLVYARGEYRKL